MKRRVFMKTAAVAGVGANLTLSHKTMAEETFSPQETLPKRPLGNTGDYLSIIGLGGVVMRDVEQERANQVVRDSIEAGVNYFDVAPTYGDAELKLGPALEPFRKGVFLACKSTKRTAKEIIEELHQSLKRLRTDYVNLYQLHALTTPEDIKTVFGKDGALEAVRSAKKDGLVRHIGFSAHSVEAAMEALELFHFDTMLAPINFVVWYNGNFGSQLVEYARSRGTAVLAIKSLAFTTIPSGTERPFPKCWYRPVSDEEKASLALRFTLSQPVTAAIPPGDEGLYRMALKLAPSFIPLAEKEHDMLKHLAREVQPIFRYPSERFNLVQQQD